MFKRGFIFVLSSVDASFFQICTSFVGLSAVCPVISLITVKAVVQYISFFGHIIT